jgi:hypothetical protein
VVAARSDVSGRCGIPDKNCGTRFLSGIRIIFLCVFCLLAAANVHAAGGEAGRAVSVVPGVLVERDGAGVLLALNDRLRDTDRIVTDATGKARILFPDDGAVTLGPARFITGKIVEWNPGGFSV